MLWLLLGRAEWGYIPKWKEVALFFWVFAISSSICLICSAKRVSNNFSPSGIVVVAHLVDGSGHDG
jgi:hypothetical protein